MANTRVHPDVRGSSAVSDSLQDSEAVIAGVAAGVDRRRVPSEEALRACAGIGQSEPCTTRLLFKSVRLPHERNLKDIPCAEDALSEINSKLAAANWLEAHGPQELELLFRAIIHLHATPLLVADNDRKSLAASAGVEGLLGIPPAKIVDRSLDDLVEPSFNPRFRDLWHSVLRQGEHAGTLPLVGEDGRARMVEYEAKGNVLPARHVLAIRDRSVSGKHGRTG